MSVKSKMIQRVRRIGYVARTAQMTTRYNRMQVRLWTLVSLMPLGMMGVQLLSHSPWAWLWMLFNAVVLAVDIFMLRLNWLNLQDSKARDERAAWELSMFEEWDR